MRVEKKIQELLGRLPEIYDRTGSKIESEKFAFEYGCLKSYLLNSFCDESIVALQFEKDYRYVLSIMACMEIGLTYVPLHVDFPEARVAQIRAITGFESLLDNEEFESILASNIPEPEKTNFNLEDKKLLYVMFTSGSTGVPKGVEIKRESYNNFLLWLDQYFDVDESDKILNTTEFTFDVFLVDIGLLLVKRASIVFSDFGDNLFKLVSEIESNRITVIATVPNNFSMILIDELIDRIDLSSLKYALIAGSKFPLSLYDKFERYLQGLQVFNCFGPTEFTIYCLVKKLGERENDIRNETVSIGTAILNTQSKIVDENFNEAQVGEVGELVVGGVQLMNGYKNNIEKTNEAIVRIKDKDFYRTGDLAFSDEHGNCYVQGRIDDTVKVSGFRVNLSDIDSYIQKFNYVKDSVTICIENEEKPNFLVSFVAKEEKGISSEEIRSDLKELLPSFQMPKFIELIDSFPLNHSGKVDKDALKAICIDRYDF